MLVSQGEKSVKQEGCCIKRPGKKSKCGGNGSFPGLGRSRVTRKDCFVGKSPRRLLVHEEGTPGKASAEEGRTVLPMS